MNTGFHSLIITEVRREISDAVSLCFAVPDDLAQTFKFVPGQHLTLRTEIDGEDIRRNYSICSAPHEGELRVAIKAVPGGVFSGFANSEIAAGQSLDVMTPHGSFTWSFDQALKRKYAGFAGGSGITPIISLIKTALRVEPQSNFALIYGNRATDSIMFLDEIAALKDRYMSRFEVFHFLEDEEGDFDLFNGRLDGAKISDVLATLIDPATIDVAFICGPGPMMDAVGAGLKAASVPDDRVLIERFTAAAMSDEQRTAARALEQQATGRVVKITIDGRRRNIAFDADKGSILENARAQGLPAPFACKAGVCATCRARMLNGEVRMKQNYGLSAKEVEQGYVLTCQAVPLTDDVELDFDA